MLSDLLNLFFPKLCYACNSILSDNEKYICVQCRHNLPVTNCHFSGSTEVEKVFYGRVKIEKATALFHFHKKGLVQELLHKLKYRGQEEIGSVLGSWLGNQLKRSESFGDINVVIPVPLHKRKLRKRGCNQVTKFGQAIANILHVEFNDYTLLKKTDTSSQVFKDRLSRLYNSKEIFTLNNPEKLKGKHILLVDDIITTGATIESCVTVLKEIKNIKVSVATIAIA